MKSVPRYPVSRPVQLRQAPLKAVVPWLSAAIFLAQPILGQEPGDETVATWNGGRLTQSEYSDGLLAEALEPGPEAVRELSFVKSLAALAEQTLEPMDARSVELAVRAKKARILLPILRRHVLDQGPAATDFDEQEIEALRLAHPEAFIRSRKLKLRNVFKAVRSPDELPAVRRAMADLHRRLEEGADFEEIARLESESQSRFRGGRLGFVDPIDLPPEIVNTLFNLRAGQLSSPLEHREGITIFLCEEIRPARIPTPDEVRAKLRVNLARQKANQRLKALEDALLAEVTIDLTALRRLSTHEPADEPAEGVGSATGDPGPVLTAPGLILEAADVPLLVALEQADRAPEDLGLEPLRSVLLRFGIGVAGAQKAMELGLHQEPSIAAQLRRARTKVLARKELVRRIDDRLAAGEIGDSELRRHYDDPGRKYRKEAEYRLAGIQFGDSSRIGEARHVIHRLTTGELGLGEAAERYSQHPSADAAGLLGWKSSRELAALGPSAARAIRALKPGETSDLLHLESGLWIFHLLDHHAARDQTFEEARPRIYRELRTRRVRDLEQELRTEHLATIDFRPVGEQPVEWNGSVVLRWSTASEHECFGYHVYRSAGEDGPFRRLTEEVVAGGGTTDLTRDYRFEDEQVKIGETYYYYIETISMDGTRKRLTPTRAVQAKSPLILP